MSGEKMQKVDKFNYLGVRITPDVGMGRKWLIGCLGKKGMGNNGKFVEKGHDIQRSKTGVI